MNAETYEKLLSELGIPSEWDAENKESLLDEKYSEVLELLDVAQQNGEEDKIARLDDEIKKIEDALEYTKEIKKRLSSGLVLNTQSDQDRLEELKGAGKEEGAQKVKQLETVSQPAANTPAPQPQVSQNNANPLLQSQMRRAKMELEDENWRLAAQLYNDILNAEPENAEANLGLFMANQRIRERKAIPEAARDAMKNNRDIFQDKQFLRAMRYADDSLQKELESYEKGGNYLIAIEALQRANTIEDYQTVSEMFDKLGDFADSRKYKEECDGHWQKPLYDATMKAMKSARTISDYAMVKNNLDKLGDYEDAREQGKLATYHGAICYMRSAIALNDVSQFSTAKEIFEKLGDYSDSKNKIEECEDGIKQLQGQIQRRQEACGKYKQEYEEFKKKIEDLPEIEQYKSKIRNRNTKIDSLERKVAGAPLFRIHWIFIIVGLGLLCYFAPLGMLKLLGAGSGLEEPLVREEVRKEIYGLVQDRGTIIAFFKMMKAMIPFLVCFLIPALIISCVIGSYNDMMVGIYCFLGVMLSVLIIPTIGIFALAYNYDNQMRIIGIVAMIIAIAMIVMKIMGKIVVSYIKTEIPKLKWRTDDDYENIEKVIGMEYQKIYDRYPDAGSDRKTVSAVQSLLLERIKKSY